MRVLLNKLKNRRKQIQGVHDGEHKEMQQTNKQQLTTRKNIKSNTKRRNKLQDSGTIREAPTPRPIK